MIKSILLAFLALFLVVVSLIAFTLFSCFRKKPPTKNVESELEQLFPGQFQVLNTNLKMLDVMALYKGDKQAVIADKADPDVQFLLDWYKGTTTVGFDSATVIKVHEQAKADVAQARGLFKLLGDSGLEHFSVGVIGQAAYVQVFAEPTPDVRRQTLDILQAVFDKKPRRPQTSLSIEFLEPAEWHHRYQDIIPSTHWKTGAGMQGEEKILSLEVSLDQPMDVPALMQHWMVNVGSKRARPLEDDAFQKALAWAGKNLPKPFFMASDDYISFEAIKSEHPSIRYGFPYYDKDLTAEQKITDADGPTGYVTGIYDFDTRAFSKIRKQKDW